MTRSAGPPHSRVSRTSSGAFSDSPKRPPSCRVPTPVNTTRDATWALRALRTGTNHNARNRPANGTATGETSRVENHAVTSPSARTEPEPRSSSSNSSATRARSGGTISAASPAPSRNAM